MQSGALGTGPPAVGVTEEGSPNAPCSCLWWRPVARAPCSAQSLVPSMRQRWGEAPPGGTQGTLAFTLGVQIQSAQGNRGRERIRSES